MKLLSIHARLVVIGGLALAVFISAGCTPSRVKFDKAAMQETKKVALVEYTVPTTVEFKNDPMEPGKKKSSLLSLVAQAAVGAMLSNNGEQAATNAHDEFVKTMNTSGLQMKLISREEMLGNPKFLAVTNKVKAEQAEQERIAAEEAEAAKKKQESTTMGKALSLFASVSGAGKKEELLKGASPKGLPSFGLPRTWRDQPSAIQTSPAEMAYLKSALDALDVDAVMVITDPGMSFSCGKACISINDGPSNGIASTGSAFLLTIMDKTGKILEMRQWFAFSDGNAPVINDVIIPLNQESLYRGHGAKMARVFTGYYKDEGGK